MSKRKNKNFKAWRDLGLKLTFNDVRLETKISNYSTEDIDISSRFSKNVSLKAPLVSAAMDTVTTSEMAIAMAKLGGIGVIHSALSAQEQRREVRKVKLSLNGLIEKPICFYQHQTVEEVLNYCYAQSFDFRNFPIVNENNKIVGVITQEKLKFVIDNHIKLSDIMLPVEALKLATPKTTIESAYQTMLEHQQSLLPLVNNKGNIKGMYLWSDAKRILLDNSGKYNVDKQGRLRVAAAIATSEQALEIAKQLDKYVDVLVIDTAQGDSKYAIQTLTKLKEEDLKADIVIGNISSASSAKQLALLGADGIKVGQGPGSICTTRVETGIGSPQVSAIFECRRVLNKNKLDIPICADGGIKEYGDISIAIAAGAENVMMGGMLAGTSESPGEKIWIDGKPHKRYRGMGSLSALKDNLSSRQRYGGDENNFPLPEGVEAAVAYKGSVNTVIKPCIQSLKKSMSYVGVQNIKQHIEETVLVQITNSGMEESKPHDVKII